MNYRAQQTGRRFVRLQRTQRRIVTNIKRDESTIHYILAVTYDKWSQHIIASDTILDRIALIYRVRIIPATRQLYMTKSIDVGRVFDAREDHWRCIELIANIAIGRFTAQQPTVLP